MIFTHTFVIVVYDPHEHTETILREYHKPASVQNYLNSISHRTLRHHTIRVYVHGTLVEEHTAALWLQINLAEAYRRELRGDAVYRAEMKRQKAVS